MDHVFSLIGRKHSGIGENVDYEHFLVSSVFSKGFFPMVVKIWHCAVKPFPSKPWFLRVCSTMLLKTLYEEGEITSYAQFLLFPQCFLPV